MFSIVIPCFNNVAILGKVLAGFAVQEFDKPFEVILVDNNGFAEDINALYLEYVDKLPLYLLRQPRLPHPRATSRARNLGLALAHHEWVINVDSDCISAPDYLERIRCALQRHGNANSIFVGLRKFIDGREITDDDILSRRCDLARLNLVASPSNYNQVLDHRLPEIENLAQCEQPWALVHSGNIAYRRDMALKIGGFDESFDGVWGYEDIDFAYRLITLTGAKPVYLAGIENYHQDGCELGRVDNRMNKSDNRNWKMIVDRIPGFEEYKRAQYAKISSDIEL